MPIYQLPDQEVLFPPPHLSEPDGLLAVGGDLSPQRLITAYSLGIFPWYSQLEPILWWSPDPRFVLYPEKLHVSKSMRSVLRNAGFRVSYDQAFEQVIHACKESERQGQSGTWITDEMEEAYCELHSLGFAHSVEVWQADELVGGLYGVAIGKYYCGESMFTKVSNASKVGFIHLIRNLREKDFSLIDCQVYTSHLERLGAERVERGVFLTQLEEALAMDGFRGSWDVYFRG